MIDEDEFEETSDGEDYENAVQVVVDDHMRTDKLGPHFVRIIREHRPTSEEIIALVAKEICKDPALKKAVKEVVDERTTENKMHYFNIALGSLGTIVLALFIWGIQQLITGASLPK